MAIRWQKSEELKFLTFLGYFGPFMAISFLLLQNDQ